MDRALLVHRLHFAFTITFPLSLPATHDGLAPLIVGLESPGLRRNDETLHQFGTFLGESLQH
jgi:hypothetical protein